MRLWLWATAGVVLAAMPAGAGLPAHPMSPAQAASRSQALMALGSRLFRQPALSASGRMACATCHDRAFGFTPANAQPVQLGGADGRQPGLRAVPTLKYLQAAPPFTEHYMGSEEDGAGDGIDQGPAGGLTWDGRVARGRDQARIPLMSAAEMANRSEAGLASRVLAAGYGPALDAIYGKKIRKPTDVVEGVTEALEAFEQDPASFYPYDSKYDAFLDGRARLTAAEARGLAAFDDPARGNCAICHRDRLLPDGGHPDFTDFGMVAVAVPRNRAIPANRDPDYFDLGLCGPIRRDLIDRPEFCGLFRTPTLRNVALKKSYFHNGVFHDLRTAVSFYAGRETEPAEWYREGGKYDDLPARYRGNIDMAAPFGVLRERDVDDITAFLGTLTDGYSTPRQTPKEQGGPG